MARNITRFADRTFFHTVDLNLLERLLAECGVVAGDLPFERGERADALFDIFFKADEASLDLHEALYSIMRLSNHNGMSLLLDLAAEHGVRIESPALPEAAGNPPPITPKHLALKARLGAPRYLLLFSMMLPIVRPRAVPGARGSTKAMRSSAVSRKVGYRLTPGMGQVEINAPVAGFGRKRTAAR